MSTKFSELLEKRNTLLHTISVWEEVNEHLSKFVGSDAAPPKLGITTRGEGLTVPTEVVEEVIAEITTKVAELYGAQDLLEETLMEDQNVSTKQSRRKEEASGSKEKGAKTKSQASRISGKKSIEGDKG